MKGKMLAVLVIGIVSLVFLLAGCPSPENKVDAKDAVAATTSAPATTADSNTNAAASTTTSTSPAPTTSKPTGNTTGQAGDVTPANTYEVPECCAT